MTPTVDPDTAGRTSGLQSRLAVIPNAERLVLAPTPRVFGILNVTPDSFSDGGRFASAETVDVEAAVSAAWALARAGADVLDIGGESTRPGSDAISVEVELARVTPVLEALRAADFPLPISVDTRRAAILAATHRLGATILNDTAALRDDPEIGDLAAELGVEVVLMHRQGVPATMQDAPEYDDVVGEVRAFFEERVAFAESKGIARRSLALDPGLGFGKSREDSYRLMAEVLALRVPETSLFVGASRKSFLAAFDDAPAADRLSGSLAFVAAACRSGVENVRVHDVRETVIFCRTYHAATEGLS